jgi:hypothetical protein
VGGAASVHPDRPGTGLTEQLARRFGVYALDRRRRDDNGDRAAYAIESEFAQFLSE